MSADPSKPIKIRVEVTSFLEVTIDPDRWHAANDFGKRNIIAYKLNDEDYKETDEDEIMDWWEADAADEETVPTVAELNRATTDAAGRPVVLDAVSDEYHRQNMSRRIQAGIARAKADRETDAADEVPD